MIKLCQLLCFLCISLCFSQNTGRAYYKKSSKIDVNLGRTAKQAPSSLNSKRINGSISNMQFTLSFKNHLALYEQVKQLESDTDERLALVFSGYSGPYYYNFKSGEIMRVQGKYLITKDRSDYQWTLHAEQIKINDLTCYKATTELTLQGRRGTIIRPVTAWYAPELNILAGPDGFGGLPGLIIQTEVQNVVTTLEKIEFNTDVAAIELPKKGQRMTEKEFEDHIKVIMENREKYYGND